MDLSNYRLAQLTDPSDLADLADGLFREMTGTIGFDPTAELGEDTFLDFQLACSPNKELQLNIGIVKEGLGPNGLQIVAEWVERSGALLPVSGAFADPAGTSIPERVGAVVWSGGVANWMLRRRNLTERLDPDKVGRVVLPMGNRQMGAGEHQLVASFAARYGRPPTEAEFAQEYIERWLSYIGFNVQVLSLDSNDLDVIHQSLFDPHTNLLDDTVLVVGNAPSAVFTAGHLRWVARSLDSKFDAGGDQLFMMGDTIPLALAGEGPATHQNPFSALGSVARNYLSLRRAIGNL